MRDRAAVIRRVAGDVGVPAAGRGLRGEARLARRRYRRDCGGPEVKAGRGTDLRYARHRQGDRVLARHRDRRFPKFSDAPSFMSYLGLVPSEDSSGGWVSRDLAIRTGNGNVYALLVKSAWHHSMRRPLTTEIAKRSAIGQQAARIASEANRRLNSKAGKLLARRVESSNMNVVVAC